MNKLRVVADANMPQVEKIFAPIADVILKDGRSLQNEDLLEADVLLVRSVTKVTPELLAGTPVKYVGTATAGLDHISQAVRDGDSVGFSSAAGANARSVVEYDLACFAWAYHNKGWNLFDCNSIGVVGYGNVGGRLVAQLIALGLNVRVFDPFADVPNDIAVQQLDELTACDCICVHAPYTEDSAYPTKGMLDGAFLDKLKPGTVLVSAGRGGIVDESAVLPLVKSSVITFYCDVWKGEPNVDVHLLDEVSLATPHIAGYSIDSKIKATQMLFDGVVAHFAIDDGLQGTESGGDVIPLNVSADVEPVAGLFEAIAKMFPIEDDDQRFRQAPNTFDRLRATYWQRREFANSRVSCENDDTRQLLLKAGFKLSS